MRRFTHHRGRTLAALVTVAIALVALAPGSWGTAVAQTAGEVQVTFTTVDGNTTTVATTQDNLATITIPPGATITGLSTFVGTGASFSDNINSSQGALNALASFLGQDALSSQSASLTFVQSADGTRLVRTSLVLNFTTPTSSLIGGRDALVMGTRGIVQHGMQAFQVGAPRDLGVVATMAINVPADALADVGGDLSRIEIVYLNEFTGEAEPVNMLPSPGPGQIEFEWTKEGVYLLVTLPLVPLPPLDIAPAQAVPAPANTGMGAQASNNTTAYIALAGVVAALVGVGGLGARFAFRRTRV